MICWSCHKHAGLSSHCGACGAAAPAEGAGDPFSTLGVERRFDLDIAAVERAYKALARSVHPDRFAKADARVRVSSLQRSVRLNDAWKTLRDPVRRAECLLSLSGYDVGGEGGVERRLPDGSKERLPVPPPLLGEVMELRESLMDARTANDHAAVASLAALVAARRSRAFTAVASGFTRGGEALAEVAAALVAIRYYDRFLEEAAAHEEARLSAGDAVHG